MYARSFSFGKLYADDASEVIVLAVGSAVGGLLLLLILVTAIAITVCLVMKWNKRKASNSSSNIHQSNTQIRCTKNEVFSVSESVTTHTNAAYKTSQPIADRLDVVYDSADMVTQHSSRNREDSTMIFDANEAYDSSNFLLYPRVTNDTVTEQSASQRERDSILKVQLNEAYESSNFPVSPNLAYELLNPQANIEDANYYATLD